MARVLIHSLLFTPDAVSIAYLLRDLARELCRHGHEVQVLTTTPHYTVTEAELTRQPLRPRLGRLIYESDVDGIKVIHISVPPKKASIGSRVRGSLQFQALALLWALFREKRFDVVLAPTQPLTMGLSTWFLAKVRGGVSIANVQDIFPDNLIRAGKIRNPLLIKCLRGLERFVYNHNSATTVITQSFCRTLRDRMRDPGRLRVIPNFVDVDLYHPLPRQNEFSREHRLDDRFVVSYAGNIGHGQDMEPLLVAAERCRDIRLTVMIIGEGIRRPWVEQEVRKRSLDNVLLLPYQPREKIPLLNASSDIGTVLLDSHIKDAAFPSKLCTVMACGRPVLVSADPGSDMAHVVREARCGRFVPCGQPERFAEAVRQAYAEREELRMEGVRGREWAETHFAREAVGRQYHELITELMDARGKRT